MINLKTYKIFEAETVELTTEQIQWMYASTGRGKWMFNSQTGLIDVDGEFDTANEDLTDFKGLKFGVVTGSFTCGYNSLTSLEGAPQEVGGSFNCSHNSLTSLEGAPQKVGGDFFCLDNKLTSLEGAPQEVEGSFNCGNNSLTSLKGAPLNIGNDFNCLDNKLTSLEGAPQEVGGAFACNRNILTSLEGAPQKVGGYFNCDRNNLISLEGAPLNIGGSFYCAENPVDVLDLKRIYKLMQNGGRTYYKAVSNIWNGLSDETKALIYQPSFDWLTPKDHKYFSSLQRYHKIKNLI